MRMLRVLEGPQWRRALPETYCTVRYYCTAPTLSTSGLCLAVDRDWRLAIPQTRQTFYCIGREPWFQDGHCRNPRARLHYISSSAPTLHLLHCAAAYTARRMAIVFGTTSIDVDDVATGYIPPLGRLTLYQRSCNMKRPRGIRAIILYTRRYDDMGHGRAETFFLSFFLFPFSFPFFSKRGSRQSHCHSLSDSANEERDLH